MNLKAGQRGAGLIEVMVTVLILSTSLLGLAALQNKSLQYNHSAYLRSQANILAYDLLDRIRINRKSMGDYDLDIDSAPTGTGLVQTDLTQWRTTLSNALPSGTGGIGCDGATHICTVTIRWEEQDAADVDDNGVQQDTTSFTYTTRI